MQVIGKPFGAPSIFETYLGKSSVMTSFKEAYFLLFGSSISKLNMLSH